LFTLRSDPSLTHAKATPAGYKPSPLGYGSPRSSPFRRPETSNPPSPLRQTTPTTSPSKLGQSSSTSRFGSESSPVHTVIESWTPRANAPTEEVPSPSRGSRTVPGPNPSTISHGSALSQLQPSQVRTLREGFQILDRDSDGTVGREDVADMLNQLGRTALFHARQ